MSDATVSYCQLRLQLFPHLISKTSKQKHLTRLPKISISQLHNWLPNQEGRWQPLRGRCVPAAESQAGRGRMEKKGDTGRRSSLLPPPCFPSSLLSWYQISQGFCHLSHFLVDINSFATLRSRSSVKPKDASRAKRGPRQPKFPTELQQPQEKT